VKQLAVQGVISDTQIDTGERMLVLQIGEIERYAGSLIISARNNPRGVPAIEKIMVASPQMSFPGIEEDQRLARIQERVILECVMQLLIEHGICLQHEGLLIFPSLFQPTEKDKAPAIPHSISLYYDFSGAIDNIYSSLVAWLGISGYFGRPRLWDDRAEFEMIGQGACGLRKIDRGGGFAHLDIYFEDKTPEDIRNIFINFVEEHLHEYGIEICETIEITCSCSFSFSEASIRRRISEGFNDIGCPECDKRIVISEGALKAREEDPELEQKSWALKTDIQAKKNKIVANVKKEFSKLEAVGIPKGSIWILHLSDLHMTSGTDFFSMLQPLISDLNKLKKELAFDRLNYLVISGDLTNYGKAQEYEVVRQFISKVIENFELSAERCIIVPGNHDIDWDENVYDWKAKRVLDVKSLEGVSFVEQGNGYLVRNTQKYPQRFSSFSKNFYHPLIQREYPLESKDQCILTPFYEDGLQFLAMNSCWEIDEFHQTSSSINLSSLSRGLCKANEQIKQFPIDRHILRIAVWHHPVTGNDKISDDAFLEQLRKENFALCLHGHVHEDRSDIIGYLHERKIRIAGAGSFGVPACDRPESVPRLYTLLEITRDHSKIKVHTRCLHKEGGAWDGYANGIPSLQRKKEHIMRLF
jgi:Icc-related predicted phosphoesterase